MPNVGDHVQGGVLFYSATTFGWVAAEKDLNPAYWGCYQTAIDGTSTALRWGSSNTDIIVSGCTGNTMIAATLCSNYSYSGYTDWFLPSKDELNEMYLAKDIIGGFDMTDNYWSSSQYNDQCAYIQYFLTGTQSELGGKDQLYRVRPIRIYT